VIRLTVRTSRAASRQVPPVLGGRAPKFTFPRARVWRRTAMSKSVPMSILIRRQAPAPGALGAPVSAAG
jgi:hypothetical protein